MPRKKASAPVLNKLYVLDTNVLLHDPYSLLKFKEHDVYIPFVTLEELDNKKSGTLDINRHARQATQLMERIVSQQGYTMESGYPLDDFNGGGATGKLFVQSKSLPYLADEHHHKNDNLYLSVLDHLTKATPGREVVMVTKDLNLRIKARALGFLAQDYLHDHAVEDADLIYRGWRELSTDEFNAWMKDVESWKEDKVSYYQVPRTDQRINEFISFPDGGFYRVVELTDSDCVLESVEDTSKSKNAVLGVTARNQEQRAALALLNDPAVDLVALLGPAGSGKTLLALASALSQVKQGMYDGVIVTRAAIPVGEDIGFLPGDEKEKMTPWMGAFFDNVEVLADLAETPNESVKIQDLAKDAMQIKAITFMRGRTLHNKVVIIDEAQNLTPKQMKTLITRAGDNAKFIALGNLAQIDSPYLSETSSGLAYLVERFKGWEHFGALVLNKGERSRLANEANERL